ncbi:MAG: GNAT family N-acetyltransferase [Nevskia sp.]|nr:GNAT family N-acetyltransferase [Nevskia sp.]
MALSIERISDIGSLEALAPEWDALAAELSPRVPFAGALWNILWWKHFRERRRAVRDDLFVHVLRDPMKHLVAVAPMMLTRRPAVGPFQIRVAQFFGADPNLTEIRGLVCRPRDQAAVVTALSRHLLAQAGEWDWVRWCGLRGDVPPPAATAALRRLHRNEPDYYLPLPASWEEFRAGLRRNIKESLRKCYNSLKRDGYGFELRVVARAEDLAAALERLWQLHTARASCAAQVRHADVFRAPRSRMFLAEYAAQMAARGQLRMFQLHVSGAVVATRMGFVLGSELYLYYSGYDPAWAGYSVATTLLAETIRWAIAQGLQTVNLSTGNDVSKTRWNPVEVPLHGGLQLAPHRRGRLAMLAYGKVLGLAQAGSPLGVLMAQASRGGGFWQTR